MSWSAVRSRPSISAWCITRMTSSLGTSVDSQITTLPTGPFHVQYVHIYIYIYYVICILYLYIICPLHVHSCFAGFYTNLAYGILPLSSWSVVLKKISASPKFCTAAGFPPFIAVSNCSNSFTDKCPDLMQIDDHMQLRHQWHPLTPSRT